MYGWIWRHLPGNAVIKSACAAVLVVVVVLLLFLVVFPWTEPRLPFGDVTVNSR